MSNPNVCILKTDGINCDVETAHAFAVVGGEPETVHVNQLRSGERQLKNYGILALSGGFSYGDDIASGAVLGNELASFLTDQIDEFVRNDRPVIGICNGFQVLTKTGLLPSGEMGSQSVSLTTNENGRFECRWIDLAVGRSVCQFAQPEDFETPTIPMQVAHGEGRFVADSDTFLDLLDARQVVFRYARPGGKIAMGYPANPNGSTDDIAGICDPKGLILGMMPHPERSIEAFHPDRSRTAEARTAATTIFSNMVEFARAS